MGYSLLTTSQRIVPAFTWLVLCVLLLQAMTCSRFCAAAGDNRTTSADYAAELRQMAEAGNADAQYGLGLLLDQGAGPAEERAEAITWLRRAADQNLAGACFALGMKYEFGATVERNPEQASALYRWAALQDLPMAQYRLGSLHLADGPLPDPPTAVAWLTLAAENGYPDAAWTRDRAATALSPAEREKAAALLADLRRQLGAGKAR